MPPTKRTNVKKLVALFLLVVSMARATTYTAASCSQAAITTALGLCASSGDTVQLPIGSATWTAGLTVSGKSVTILGASSYGSQITISYTGGAVLGVICDGTNYVRVSGIDWILGSGANTEGAVQIGGSNDTGTRALGFRFDHNRFTFSAASGRMLGIFYVWGLVDHNEFYQTGGSTIQMIQTYGSSDNTDNGQTPQGYASTLGDANAIYIEDNIFSCSGTTQGDDCIDSYGGVSYVVRHNAFTNNTQGHHGMDSGSRRGVVRFEWYSNTYVNNTSYYLRYGTVRSGFGVVYGNTYSGSHAWDGITLQYYRAYQGLAEGISFQKCDGTTYYMPTSGAAPLVTSGGRGFDNTNNRSLGTNGAGFTNKVDGAGTAGYPGRDQPGFEPGMVSHPIHVWGNSPDNSTGIWAGTASGPDADALANMIQLNRDYIVGTADSGWTAYTYPHPLQGGTTVASKYGGKSKVGGRVVIK